MAEQTAAGSPTLKRALEGRDLYAYLRHVLPQGRTLPEDVWRRRHNALLALLWLHAVGLAIFGAVQGYGAIHTVTHGGVLATLAVLAMLVKDRRRVAAALVALGLITSSAVLVHTWHGVIEGHFHFFVMIALLSLYEDWLSFLVAAAYVVVHHGLAGALDPGAVYNHPDAVAHPWKWAAIHGLFVTAAGISAVAAWRLNEDVRAESRESYRRARESEERFKSAFEEAPIGMVLASIESERVGGFLQVNRAMCEIMGYSEQELVERSFRSITHPDDLEQTTTVLEKLLRGKIPRFNAETRYVRSDGEVVWVLVNVSLVRDGGGDAAYAIAQVQDISERKRAQEQLAYQALHDPLTGLPNRRRLLADLDEHVAAARPEQPTLLLLFDLDGFKAYNDTYGHVAGDSLLSRLARNLETSIGDQGCCYRMGGDEFCILAPSPAEHGGIEAIASSATEALSERGQGFVVTASYGSVLLPVEAANAADALRMADQRMYARKSLGSRASAGRQSTAVLVKVLSERSPDLGIHLNTVTELCQAVALRFGMPDDELAALLQAASLHDVGMAAIPDEIVNKPGPLDEEEQDFVRRHPVIGERILGAAPALSQAAKLVRSAHERFDGSGYPDGLAGEEIPLAARIIAVCDAFDAMTADRPHRTAMSVEGALSELERCAGTQFDPRVLDAFRAVLVERADRPVAATA